mmetsp:Transcript_50502/g.153627  ORF Transcript_50502/g.153627 Transcript_50502/m.153627 type:complete len:255 (+) Transcript_50502:238-1002(+)
MRRELNRLRAPALLPLEGRADQLGASGRAMPRHRNPPALDLLLPPEGKRARHQAEHDDAEGPDIDLVSIVLLEELRGPISARPAIFRQPLAREAFARSIKIAQVNLVIGVRDVFHVHHEIVTLHVTVDTVPGLDKRDSAPHLSGKVLYGPNVHLAVCFPMRNHTLDHVSALVQLHHEAHRELVMDMEHGMQLGYRRVLQPLHHGNLFVDVIVARRLEPVDHFDSDLRPGGFVRSPAHHAMGAFSQHLVQVIFRK